MQKRLLVLASALVFSLLAFAGNAAAITFTPNSGGWHNDLMDLDHNYYYVWTVEAVPGQEVLSAELTIENIYNWDTNDNRLGIFLLDSPDTAGMNLVSGRAGVDVWRQWDGESYYPAPWTEGPGATPVGTWTDLDGPATMDTLTFSLDPAILEAYLADGIVGFGFDPDCHFYNTRVSLNIVPEPGTLLLFGSGLLGLALMRRRGQERS